MGFIEERKGGYRIGFRFGGKLHRVMLLGSDRAEAESALARVEENLRLIVRGRLAIPDGAEIGPFLLSDGKITSWSSPDKVGPKTLEDIFAAFSASEGVGLEANTLKLVAIHSRHLFSTLGKRFPIRSLSLSDLEMHVTRRAKAKGRGGRPLSASTIRKEIQTLSSVWNWGRRRGFVEGPYPSAGLTYPKVAEKLPFATRSEIEARIARGASKSETRDLWASLFLTLDEIRSLVDVARGKARHPWIAPMILSAAHTGARRSELLRARVEDVDFESSTWLIREKKRVKGKLTTRRVSLSGELSRELQGWIDAHPGGRYLFCWSGHVNRSKTKGPTTGHINGPDRPKTKRGRDEALRPRPDPGPTPITIDESNHHLRLTLSGTSWRVVKGWHVFRHSFASNCAARGVDQRIIDAWMGHQTEEMRKRYRHLYPDQQSAAIRSVFPDRE